MFSDEQLRQHIRELQQFLFGISHYNVRIPVIIPDGIYGRGNRGSYQNISTGIWVNADGRSRQVYMG